MARYLYDLETMGEVVEAFWQGYLGFNKKYPLIIKAGNLLFDSGGENITAQFFLRNFLVEYLRGPKNCLALSLVVADIAEEEKRAYWTNQILEDCFSFLKAYQEKLRQDTRWALEAVVAKPPHKEFLRYIEGKISLFKKMKRCPDMRFAGVRLPFN